MSAQRRIRTGYVDARPLRRWKMFVVLAWTLAGMLTSARAVEGVMDTVILVGDQTDLYKWPRELEQWQMLIAECRIEVQRTEEVIKETERVRGVLGSPEGRSGIRSVPDLMKPAQDAAALETAKHAIESGRNLFTLSSRSVKTYRANTKVEPTFEVFGETVTRDESRYGHFAILEAMAGRCRTSSTNEETVVQKELDVQKLALDDLASARTHADVALQTAKITASHQRQAAARQKAAQAKADFELFRSQLATETERKREGDREWAQVVVRRMREKAMAAYSAQTGEPAVKPP